MRSESLLFGSIFLFPSLTIALLGHVNLISALAFPSFNYSRSLAFADFQTHGIDSTLEAL